VIETVAVIDVALPSDALKVKESLPVNPAPGV